jgi:hypothetical protein
MVPSAPSKRMVFSLSFSNNFISPLVPFFENLLLEIEGFPALADQCSGFRIKDSLIYRNINKLLESQYFFGHFLENPYGMME